MRESEFAERMLACPQAMAEVVDDPARARWAAQMTATTAIGAVMAWLDAGQPDPDLIAARILATVEGIIRAAQAAD